MHRLTATDLDLSYDTVRVLARALGISAGAAEAPLARLVTGLPVYATKADAEKLARIGIEATPCTTAPPPMPTSPRFERLRDRLEAVVGPDGVPFGPPATEEDVALVESRVGPLPDDYKAWLGVATGHDSGGPFAHWVLTPLETALSTHALRTRLFADDPAWWRPDWFEFAENGSGDSLCLDLRDGSVLEFRHDDSTRPRLADRFHDWLLAHVEALERGDFVVLEHQGTFDGVLPRSELRGAQADLHVRGESPEQRAQRVAEAHADPYVLAPKLYPRLLKAGVLEVERGVFPPLHLFPALVEGLESPNPAWGLAKALRGCPGVVRVGLPAELQAVLDELQPGD